MAVEGSVMEATFSRNMSLRKLKGLTARNHLERNDNLWCLGPGVNDRAICSLPIKQ